MTDNVYVIDDLAPVGSTITLVDADGDNDWLVFSEGRTFAQMAIIDLSRYFDADPPDAIGTYYPNAAPNNAAGSLVVRGLIENARGSNSADDIQGNQVANIIYGDNTADGPGGDDIISGNEGDDLIYGGAGDDVLGGAADNDRLFGGAGDDSLQGDEGDDYIEGGVGADSMFGGSSSGDTLSYSSSNAGVTLHFNGDNGNTASGGHATGDSFNGFRNFVGSNHNDVIEDDLKGTIAFGRSDNVVSGNGGNDILRLGGGADTGNGGDGNDQLFGEAEADRLVGGSGDDILDGGAGADTMNGGAGVDRYYVDNAGDRVLEAVGGGVDRVYTSVSFNAGGQDIEQVYVSGSVAANVAGNALDNLLVGNAANNYLNGGAGADDMRGGAGNDTYGVENTGDRVTEAAGGGTDTVRSAITYTLGANVENLTLVGSVQVNGIGNELANVLIGSSRSNVLIGMGGRDVMTGGGGADRFDFRAVSDSTFAAYDRITDLEAQDVINLSAIDANANVAGNQAFALVSAFTGAGGQMTRTYSAANDFTILTMDVNGDRVGDMRIVLDGDHRTYANFSL